MGGFSVIVNPAAGHGRAMAAVPLATAALDAAAAHYQVSRSASLGHAAQLAAQAAAAGDVVVAVGGAGMAGAPARAAPRPGGRVGVMPAGRGKRLAPLPGGTAHPGAP